MFNRRRRPAEPPEPALAVPGRIEARSMVVVPGPVDVVWQLIEAPQLALEDPAVVEADWVGAQRGVGGRQAFVTRNADGTSTASVVEILEWDPPRLAVLSTIAGTLPGFSGGGSFELADMGDGHTRVVYTSWSTHPAGMTPTLLARVGELVQAGADKVAQQVAAAVARRTGPPASPEPPRAG